MYEYVFFRTLFNDLLFIAALQYQYRNKKRNLSACIIGNLFSLFLYDAMEDANFPIWIDGNCILCRILCDCVYFDLSVCTKNISIKNIDIILDNKNCLIF